MSSINIYPTFNYSQPDDYHFSHDSVFLARQIFERCQSLLEKPNTKILDLCSGCGIVGLDFLYHVFKANINFTGQIDFLEIQEIYLKHFQKNKKTLNDIFSDSIKKVDINFIQTNYANHKVIKKYDLIISNPPFFLKNQGLLSENEFKNRCRFFIDSDWQSLIQFIKSSLNLTGQAYFLLRDDLKKVIELENIKNVSFPFQIRGTWVALIKV